MGCNGFSLYAAVHRQKGENDTQNKVLRKKFLLILFFVHKEKNRIAHLSHLSACHWMRNPAEAKRLWRNFFRRTFMRCMACWLYRNRTIHVDRKIAPDCNSILLEFQLSLSAPHKKRPHPGFLSGDPLDIAPCVSIAANIVAVSAGEIVIPYSAQIHIYILILVF